MSDSLVRKIIHVDMDAFYASVEQRDEPMLKGRPVAVGYAAARSCRRCQLRSTPIRRAIRHAVGHRDAQVFGTRVRPASIRGLSRRLPPDSDNLHRLHATGRTAFSRRSLSRRHRQPENIPTAWATAKEIRARILDETGLTASAG